MNRTASSGPSLSMLERLVFIHALGLIVTASWVYGGNIWWMRTVLAAWASLSLPLAIAAILQAGGPGRDARRQVWWLIPWLGFIALVALSAFNPSFTAMRAEDSPVLVHTGPRWPGLPSCIDPATTLRELWFYAAVYLSGFNLLLVPQSRRLLRNLLLAGVVNCLLLAVFASMQHLIGAGYYFGATTSPNARHFGTFIYNNHWGAFMVLWLAAASALLFYQTERHRGRDLWHSPVSLFLLALLLIAATAPLSASRAATAMAGVVLALILATALLRIRAHRHSTGRSTWPPVLAVLIVTVVACSAIAWLAQRSITERYRDTRSVLDRDESVLDGRLALYRDTWELVRRKPWFGWGFESYGAAFLLIRPRPLEPGRQYEASYTEAHSDWLQSLAETGFVGSSLALLSALLPLAALRRRAWREPLVTHVLFGCLLVTLYAWIEFPFANGAVLISFWMLYFGALGLARLGPRSAPSPPCIPSSS